MNGTKRGSQHTYPNEVIFSCDDGFNLRGSAKRECTADGTWNGVETICEGRTLLNGGEKFASFMHDIYLTIIRRLFVNIGEYAHASSSILSLPLH